MNPLVYYLLQVVIASGILYLYYHIALRNKKFHQYNRFYLLGAVVISILVPFLNIPVYFTPQETQSSIVLETLTVISSPVAEEPIAIDRSSLVHDAAPVSAFNPYDLIYYTYLLIAVLALLKVGFSILKISRLKRNNEVEKIDTIFFVNTDEPGTPFSFFRWLFWNREIELRSEKGEQIFRHELFHIQQKHSLDLLFMELLTVVFWINPFFHLMKKELRAIHEFLADQFAVNRSNKWDYAELLLMQALQTKYTLVNPFFHNQIKRRIAMITNPEKTSYRYLRKLLVLPVAVLIVTVFAFKYKEAGEKDVAATGKPITIVVDASHGGIDPGTQSPDGKYSEAQLSLAIAKKIQQLAPEYNIDVIMTREDDAFPRGSTTIEDANRKRVEIAREADAEAFIAIHVNSASSAKEFQQGRSGIEGYISYLRDDPGTKSLGSSILQQLSAVHKTMMDLRTRKNQGIFVLDHSPCPAVILECGYINNATDLAFITDEANQEKIARSILAGVVKHKEEFSRDNVSLVTFKTNGTLPSFIDDSSSFLRSKAAIFFTHEKVIIACDSLISHDKVTNGPYPELKDYNIIVDGKKETYTYFRDQTVKAKEATMYSKDHPDAIKLYANQPTIILKGASVISTLPPYQYYKINEQRDRAAQDTDKIVFEKVEIEASYPGGEKAWRKFLEQNLDAAVPVKNGAKPGTYTVFIQFIVDKDGNTRDFKALTKHGYGLEQESLKCLKNSGKWNPGLQNGRKVNSIRKQPITFRVTSEEKSISQANHSLTDVVVQGYSTGNKTTKTLDNVTIIGNYPDPGKQALNKRIKMAGPILVGSPDWKKYLERNLDGEIPALEGKKPGTYELFIHFAVDKDGNITDAMVRNYDNSKLSKHCREMIRIVSKVIIPDDMVKGETTFYVQPITFMLPPAFTPSELKNITVHELLDLDKSTEVKRFTFTIDLPDGNISQVVNTGDKFNDAIQKLLKNAVPRNIITVESIVITFGGMETKMPARFYYVISDNYKADLTKNN